MNDMMTPEDTRLQKTCLARLYSYKGTTVSSLKRTLRNGLFCLLKDKLIQWISAVVRNKSKREIMSLAWDGFCRALKSWKENNQNVYQHFRRYTVYEVLTILSEKSQKEMETYQIRVNFANGSDPDKTIVTMIAIKDLRESLTGRNRQALDDLITGDEWTYMKEPSRNAYYARRNLIKEMLKGIIN